MAGNANLERLDGMIRRLRIDYEQYFMRALKREPLDLRKEVDELILRYTRLIITNTADRFQFQSILSKYTTYKQYWERTLRDIESGKYRRRSESGESSVMEELRSSGYADLRPSAEKPPKGGKGNDIDAIYDQFVASRRGHSEPTAGLTKEALARKLGGQIEKVKERFGVDDVDLSVYVKDGKTKIGIKPKKG